MGRTKRCQTCKQTKPLEAFSLNRTERDGYQTTCKQCHKDHYAASKSKPSAPIQTLALVTPTPLSVTVAETPEAALLPWQTKALAAYECLTADAPVPDGRAPIVTRRDPESSGVGPAAAWIDWGLSVGFTEPEAGIRFAPFRAWFIRTDKPTKAGWLAHLEAEARPTTIVRIEPDIEADARKLYGLWHLDDRQSFADFRAWIERQDPSWGMPKPGDWQRAFGQAIGQARTESGEPDGERVA